MQEPKEKFNWAGNFCKADDIPQAHCLYPTDVSRTPSFHTYNMLGVLIK